MDDFLAAEIESLQQRDVATRERLLQEGRLYGSYDDEMQTVHVENAMILDRILSARGWPGVSMVGPAACRAAWLVAQHSICTPDLQRGFLRALAQAADVGDVPKKQVAMLADRIRFNEGRPQVYGTVFDWNEKGLLDCMIEDPEHVDERRTAVGLGPFDESLQQQRDSVAAEGGKAPEDFKAYRAASAAWAEKVGWR